MSKHVSVALAAALSVLAAGCGSSPKKTKTPTQDAIAPDSGSSMSFTVSNNAPGESHRYLDPMVGDFSAKATFWESASAMPQTSNAQAKSRWILDGRFVLTDFRGQMFGDSFEGVAMMGYDNAKQCYVSTWADTTSTALLPIAEGTCSRDGKVFTSTRRKQAPSSGAWTTERCVTTVVSRDRHTFEMFVTPDGGTEYRALEIVYTRVQS